MEESIQFTTYFYRLRHHFAAKIVSLACKNADNGISFKEHCLAYHIGELTDAYTDLVLRVYATLDVQIRRDYMECSESFIKERFIERHRVLKHEIQGQFEQAVKAYKSMYYFLAGHWPECFDTDPLPMINLRF